MQFLKSSLGQTTHRLHGTARGGNSSPGGSRYKPNSQKEKGVGRKEDGKGRAKGVKGAGKDKEEKVKDEIVQWKGPEQQPITVWKIVEQPATMGTLEEYPPLEKASPAPVKRITKETAKVIVVKSEEEEGMTEEEESKGELEKEVKEGPIEEEKEGEDKEGEEAVKEEVVDEEKKEGGIKWAATEYVGWEKSVKEKKEDKKKEGWKKIRGGRKHIKKELKKEERVITRNRFEGVPVDEMEKEKEDEWKEKKEGMKGERKRMEKKIVMKKKQRDIKDRRKEGEIELPKETEKEEAVEWADREDKKMDVTRVTNNKGTEDLAKALQKIVEKMKEKRGVRRYGRSKDNGNESVLIEIILREWESKQKEEAVKRNAIDKEKMKEEEREDRGVEGEQRRMRLEEVVRCDRRGDDEGEDERRKRRRLNDGGDTGKETEEGREMKAYVRLVNTMEEKKKSTLEIGRSLSQEDLREEMIRRIHLASSLPVLISIMGRSNRNTVMNYFDQRIHFVNEIMVLIETISQEDQDRRAVIDEFIVFARTLMTKAAGGPLIPVCTEKPSNLHPLFSCVLYGRMKRARKEKKYQSETERREKQWRDEEEDKILDLFERNDEMQMEIEAIKRNIEKGEYIEENEEEEEEGEGEEEEDFDMDDDVWDEGDFMSRITTDSVPMDTPQARRMTIYSIDLITFQANAVASEDAVQTAKLLVKSDHPSLWPFKLPRADANRAIQRILIHNTFLSQDPHYVQEDEQKRPAIPYFDKGGFLSGEVAGHSCMCEMRTVLEGLEPPDIGQLAILFMNTHGNMEGDSTRVMAFKRSKDIPIKCEKCNAKDAPYMMPVEEIVKILDKKGGDWLLVPLVCRSPATKGCSIVRDRKEMKNVSTDRVAILYSCSPGTYYWNDYDQFRKSLFEILRRLHPCRAIIDELDRMEMNYVVDPETHKYVYRSPTQVQFKSGWMTNLPVEDDSDC